jgi:putative oxidoreductase
LGKLLEKQKISLIKISVLKLLLNVQPTNTTVSLKMLRIGIAIILIVHPLHALSPSGSMEGFGKFLSVEGFPVGYQLAWITILTQLISSAALVLGRLIIPSCIAQITILSIGLWISHISEGWFVVDPGHDGLEYSVTLLVCLIAILF